MAQLAPWRTRIAVAVCAPPSPTPDTGRLTAANLAAATHRLSSVVNGREAAD